MAFFHGEVSRADLTPAQRVEIYNAVLDVFLQNRSYAEAENIHKCAVSEGIQLSEVQSAKLLSLRYAHDELPRRVFYKHLRKYFILAGSKFEEAVLRDILEFLIPRFLCPPRFMEAIVQAFTEAQGDSYYLGPRTLAVIIRNHTNAGRIDDAERWVDYHSQRLRTKAATPTADDLAPYTSYVHGLTDKPATKEPHLVYNPVLQRMADDGISPDSGFINAMIDAELHVGNITNAFNLYGLIRSRASQTVYPDEVTFKLLFSVMARITRRKLVVPQFPIPPRSLFKEMLEHHARSTRGMRPVASSWSLGSALWYFTVAEDYAAAYRALYTMNKLRVPLQEGFIKAVMTAFLARCVREAAAPRYDESLRWVDIFLQVEGRAKFSKLQPQEVLRKIADAGRWSLDTSTPPNESLITAEDDVDLKKAWEKASVRGRKNIRMRENRLRLVSALLIRALASCYSAEPALSRVLDKESLKAIEDSIVDMIPSEEPMYRDFVTAK